MLRIIGILVLYCCTLNTYAWNKLGHQIVAQIAYDHLSIEAKQMCRKYLGARSKKPLNAQFLAAAVWLDMIRYRKINWYDAFHYIDIPFAVDNTPLPPIETNNAIWGINHALSILDSKKTTVADKKFALFILLHVVGDIHQPLHAVTRVSNELPRGDLGGNLFPLGTNKVGNNLHKYWDSGAGFLIGSSSMKQVKKKAHLLEQRWSCSVAGTQKDPEQWVQASHLLAVNQVYQINPKEVPSKHYQENAQNTVQEQMVIAGCRLATLLNAIASI